MTQPHQFTTVQASQEAKRDSAEFIPMARTRGKLLIVRPLKYQAEGFITEHKPEGTDAIFCDIALLDPIEAAVNEYGEQLSGFPAETQFRDQILFQGYLKGTFKRYLGATLIGTTYFGPKTKGKPPIMWQDLSGDPQCVLRGQQFLAAHPEFLVPTAASFNASTPEPQGPQPYTPPPPQNGSTGGYGGYRQPDPWAQPVSGQPQSAPPPSSAPPQQMSTLEQMRRAAQVQQAAGDGAPPF